jgi:hypothetical protein
LLGAASARRDSRIREARFAENKTVAARSCRTSDGRDGELQMSARARYQSIVGLDT